MKNGLHAVIGDRLIVHGVHVGQPVRDAEILEVRGEDGSPPFLVRWSDTGHEGLVYPGPDAHVQHFEHPTA
ncbi:MAG: DUF1918 domain-containing protein [Nocardioides sp.]